jgi:hypothetical protein
MWILLELVLLGAALLYASVKIIKRRLIEKKKVFIYSLGYC